MSAAQTAPSALSAGAFQIQGADGGPVFIPAGEYYMNTKPRIRRMMRCGLSREAQRVYACVESHSMGYRSETALVGGRMLRPSDIARETGLGPSHVRRALRELEAAGLVERQAIGGGGLTKGNVKIVSRALPPSGSDPPERKEAIARPQSATWGSDTLRGAFRRLKIARLDELGPSRGLNPEELDEMEAIARRMAEDEKRLRALAESVRAKPEPAAPIRNKETERDVRTDERPSEPARPPAVPIPVEAEPARETLCEQVEAVLAKFPDLFPVPADDRLLSAIATRLKDTAALPFFEARVRRLKRVERMGLLLNIADDAAKDPKRSGKRQAQAPPGPPGVCPECEGRGVVARVTRGIGSAETCICQRRKPPGEQAGESEKAAAG